MSLRLSLLHHAMPCGIRHPQTGLTQCARTIGSGLQTVNLTIWAELYLTQRSMMSTVSSPSRTENDYVA